MSTVSEARAEPAPPAASRAFYLPFQQTRVAGGWLCDGTVWFVLDDDGELHHRNIDVERVRCGDSGEDIPLTEAALFIVGAGANKALKACPLFQFLAREEAENVWGPSPDPWAGERLSASQLGLTAGRV